MLSPDRVGEPLGRNDLAACEHQHGEYGALPPPTQIEHGTVVRRRELAEQVDPQLVRPHATTPTATVNEEDSFRHRLRGR